MIELDATTEVDSILGSLTLERLKTLSERELDVLAAEVREFLVQSVSTTGGHLGSNLGVVELSIALHRVFHSPDDAIIWDTGHQAYVHKLLTGRDIGFHTLRRAGGLSGYPNRQESAHDVVENSHASTGLSYAFGLASARALAGDPRHVVAVVGDGALTGGVAYEALSNLAVSRAKVVVVLNDNGRSYAPTISPLSTADDPARSASSTAAFFGSLGIAYVGPVDGHDVGALEAQLHRAARATGPIVLHVHTTKGKGYPPAERDGDRCLHDVGPFDPATGVAATPATPRRTYTEAFSKAIVREAAAHPELVAITAAMGSPTGLLAFRERHPDRFFDVGIAEQHAVNAAAGMAMGGLRPVVAVYSTFLNRAWDQIYYDVGLHRLPVIFCIDRAGITGEDGPSHHGALDMMLLTKVPGMTVLAPSSYEELGVMFHEALQLTNGPVSIRWPKTEARREPLTGTGLRARRIRRGRGVCLIGVGKLVDACERASEHLGARGIEATVWDARCLQPLDGAMLDDAGYHDLVVTVEDGIADGGVGSFVRAALGARGGRSPKVITRGIPTSYLPHGHPDELLSGLGLDANGICHSVVEHL